MNVYKRFRYLQKKIPNLNEMASEFFNSEAEVENDGHIWICPSSHYAMGYWATRGQQKRLLKWIHMVKKEERKRKC